MAKKEHKTNGISSIMEDNGKSSDRSAKILEKRKERQFSKKTMKAEENHDVNQERLIEEDPKSNDGIIESGCTKRKKIFFKEAANVEEKHEISRMSPLEDRDQKVKIRKNKKNKRLLQKTNEPEEEREGHGECTQEELNLKSSDGEADVGINKWENVHLEEACMSAKVQVNMEGSTESKKPESDNRKSESNNSQKKQRLLEEAVKADQCGVCYLSRIPPHMDHVKLRQILSQYGEIQRIYLAPEGPATQVSHKRVKRKRDGGFQEQVFSEGWVEFTKKSLAKRVAHMLNGEQIGGRKRSSFYYDLWNIKYLSKFKWDDLTEEIAYKNAIREQKLALEISAAKRERDFYLSKVEKSRALSSIEERMKKKQKLQEELKSDSQVPVTQQSAKVIRQFQQKQPVADDIAQSKPRLSKDVLVGVFGNS